MRQPLWRWPLRSHPSSRSDLRTAGTDAGDHAALESRQCPRPYSRGADNCATGRAVTPRAMVGRPRHSNGAARDAAPVQGLATRALDDLSCKPNRATTARRTFLPPLTSHVDMLYALGAR